MGIVVGRTTGAISALAVIIGVWRHELSVTAASLLYIGLILLLDLFTLLQFGLRIVLHCFDFIIKLIIKIF